MRAASRPVQRAVARSGRGKPGVYGVLSALRGPRLVPRIRGRGRPTEQSSVVIAVRRSSGHPRIAATGGANRPLVRMLDKICYVNQVVYLGWGGGAVALLIGLCVRDRVGRWILLARERCLVASVCGFVMLCGAVQSGPRGVLALM